VIYYGSWSISDKFRINQFLSDIGRSAWYEPTTKYYQVLSGLKQFASSDIRIKNSTNDYYSVGKNITNIDSLIQSKVASKIFPMDTNGIYILLTSSDVVFSQSGLNFCSNMCGFHSYNSLNMKYFAAGRSPETCLCTSSKFGKTYTSSSLNSLLSVIAHELVETVVDPNFDAWTTETEENLDLCNWNLLGVVPDPAFGDYNVVMNGQKYLIQANYDINTQKCVNQKSITLSSSSSSSLAQTTSTRSYARPIFTAKTSTQVNERAAPTAAFMMNPSQRIQQNAELMQAS
jgi:hypothetical protein